MLALVRLVRNQKSTDLRWSEKVQEHRWRSAMVGEEHQSAAQEECMGEKATSVVVWYEHASTGT
jgi:hypothetical protein